jgi:hypothetical protein
LDLRDGDVVFQISLSRQSRAIQLATHSRYSHVGIVFFIDGQPMVLEASTTTRFLPWDLWVAKGQSRRFVVKRLREADRILPPEVVKRMRAMARPWLGRKYDLLFEWTDDRMYCSELVWKLYQRCAGVELSNPKILRDLDLSNPLVRRKLEQRYKGKIPMDQPMVPPSDLYASPWLTSVSSIR